MERGFADRNGAKLGDRLAFDVQGIPVEGRVTSIRRVRWTDFHPNFFMEFQAGVLEDAPKTWLASVTATKGPPDAKARLLRDLLDENPEISAIDVGRALEKAGEAARAVAAPTQGAAWAATAIAFVVLAATVMHALRARRREFDVQKLVGANASLIRRLAALEYGILSGVGALAGALGGLGASYWIVRRFFETAFHINAAAIAISFATAVIACSGLAWWAVDRALRTAGASSRL